MKKVIVLFTLMIALGSAKTYAQLGDLEKQAKSALNTVTPTQKDVLANLDKTLITQFGLDGAKSTLVGNALKIKVADTDFKKLSSPQLSKTSNSLNSTANTILNALGTDLLKKIGLGDYASTIIELVTTMTSSGALKTSVFPKQ